MGSKNKIKEYTTCTGKTPSCIVGTPDPVQDDSARWSTEREFVSGLESAEMSSSEPIARAGFPMDVIDGRVYFDPGEAHTIAFGSTGSGKTNYIASPSIRIIARSGESLFVNDPKGDLSRDNYDYLVLHGYTVFVFHGRKPSISRRWNPLEIPYRFYHSENVVDRDEAQNMIMNLAECISPVRGVDPFWETSAQKVIIGLCNVLFHCCKDPSKINMRSICVLKEMIAEKNPVLMRYLDGDTVTTAEKLNLSVVLNNADNTARCIYSMVDHALSKFASQDMIAWMTSASDFDLRELGRSKVAVFIVTPDEDDTYDMLVSLLVKQSYKLLVSEAQNSPGLKLQNRVNYILDEFGNIPTIPGIAHIITASRSRNIRFLLLVQDKSQLEEKYGKLASSIISNCSNIMYLNGRDTMLLTELSEMAGKDRNGIPIVSTSRLQRLSKERKEAFVLRDRERPFISRLAGSSQYAGGSESEPDFPMMERTEIPTFGIEDLDQCAGPQEEKDFEDFLARRMKRKSDHASIRQSIDDWYNNVDIWEDDD